MSTVADRLRARAPAAAAAVQDQVTVAAGQVAAGLGNMAFSLLMARVLSPGAFGQLASFLALYLVLGMPASAISAAAAVRPDRVARLRPTFWAAGVAAAVLVTATSPWVGPMLRLPVGMVIVLGLSCPALGTLALERGRLYGWLRHRRLVASFLVEPATRLLLGVGLAVASGAAGGALGVAVAGYAALEVARRRRRSRRPPAHAAGGARRPLAAVSGHAEGTDLAEAAGHAHQAHDAHGARLGAAGLLSGRTWSLARWTAATFLALVVIQNQDLLLANRLLTPAQAGQFAVLSTLGGLAVFATMTVPLVLLPRTAAGERGGLLPALSLTVLIGGAAVGLVALAPGALVAVIFGGRYREIGPLLVPYLGAMALLGVGRVLAAHRCARGRGRSSLATIVLAAVLQALLIATFGHDPRSVALSTVVAVTGMTATLGVAEVVRVAEPRRRVVALTGVWRRPFVAIVAGACTVGLIIRLIVTRGLWLDEATSVYQARMGYAAMLHNLRTTDVHPPLYFSVLWLFVHAWGSSELMVRLPSIIAGTLVIPMLYVLGREAYDRRTGVVAAAAGSVAPLLVWYSQDARMYALMALFGLIAMWAQVRLLRGRGGAPTWAAYAAASIALSWTQYFGLLQLAFQQLVFAGVVWRRWRRGEQERSFTLGWVLSALAIAVWLVPLMPFAYQQYIVNQTAGKGFGAPSQTGSATALSGHHLNVYSALADLLWAVWGYHADPTMRLLAALWPLGMLFALVLLGRHRRPVTTLLVAAIVGQGLAMFGLGLVKQNLFDVRYLSTSVPVLFVLIARLVTAVPRRVGTVVIASCLLLVSLGAGLLDQQLNGSNPRLYDFRGALASVEARARPGDVVLYEPTDLREVVLYYAPHLRLVPVGRRLPSPRGNRAEFVVASRSLMNGRGNRAALSHALADLGHHGRLVAHRTFPNVQTWEFRSR